MSILEVGMLVMDRIPIARFTISFKFFWRLYITDLFEFQFSSSCFEILLTNWPWWFFQLSQMFLFSLSVSENCLIPSCNYVIYHSF